jgi:outer membrane protein TolC
MATSCRPPRLDSTAVLKSLREERSTPSLQQPLDEESAVSLALANNTALEPARREAQVARGSYKAASDIENPTIRVTWDDLNSTTRSNWEVSARWEPPKPWSIASKQEIARQQIAKAEEQLAERALALKGEVKKEHAELVFLEQEIEVAKSAAESRRALLGAIEARVSKGAGTRLDTASARVSVAEAEAAVSELNASRATCIERLRGLLGVAPGEAYTVKGTPPERREVPVVGALEELALKSRPELKIDLARHNAQTEEVARARMANLPWLKITAGPEVEVRQFDRRVGITAGVELSFPLWDWNTGHIAEEEAKLSRDEARYRAEVANLRRDVAVARSDLEARRNQVEQLEKQLIPALEQRLEVAKKGLEAATMDTTVLLDAEERLWRGRRQFVRANRELKQAWIRLERVLGAPIP